jgi:hypothetical protein
MLESQLKAYFLNFCKRQLQLVQTPPEHMAKPLKNFTSLVVHEFCKLNRQLARERRGMLGSSSSEEEEGSSLTSILNQFKKVAEVSGLTGFFARKEEEKEKPKAGKNKETAVLNQLSVCRFFDAIRAAMER